MYTSVWYHTNERCPKKNGHYLAYKTATLGDDSEGFGLYYWDNYYTEWRGSMALHSSSIEVSIWSECPVHDPDNYMPLKSVPAEINAWKKVCEAVDQYNVIRGLVR